MENLQSDGKDLSSSVYVLNPDAVIDDAIKRRDWLSGFSNSVVFFEHYGYFRLRWYCLKERIDLSKKLEGLHVSTLTLILYLLKIIDADTFSKMNKTIKERNMLTHPISAEAGISYRETKEKTRATQLLEDAKFCIRKLREGIGNK